MTVIVPFDKEEELEELEELEGGLVVGTDENRCDHRELEVFEGAFDTVKLVFDESLV